MINRIPPIAIALLLIFLAPASFAQKSEDKMPHKYYLELLEKAEAGDAKSQEFFGTIYMYGNDIIEGITIKQDAEKALHWLTLAADNGNPHAAFNLHLIYRNDQFGIKKDSDKSFKWCFEAARHEIPLAQYTLALMYMHGEGVSPNIEEAVLYMDKAAAQQFPPALSQMGEFYFHGVGVQQSYIKASDLYLVAAQKGRPVALQRLSQINFEGLGVPVDRLEAYKWIVLAALTGDQESISLKEQFDSQISSALIHRGEEMANKWLKTHDRYRETFPR